MSSSGGDSASKSFIFSFVMCIVCGTLLTFGALGLKSRQEMNIAIDKQKNVLKSLGFLDNDRRYSSEEITGLYVANVQEAFLDVKGNFVKNPDKNFVNDYLPVYIVGRKSDVKSYVVPFSAYGLWSWVDGYIAIDGDGTTIKGFTVYSHGETPGLGGECEKPWFQNQFKGKRIADSGGKFTSIGVVKGKVKDVISSQDQRSYYVDGISGATITGVGIGRDLKKVLIKYEPFSVRLRSS